MEAHPGIMNHLQLPAQQVSPSSGVPAPALTLGSDGPILHAKGPCKRKVRRAWCEDASFWL